MAQVDDLTTALTDLGTAVTDMKTRVDGDLAQLHADLTAAQAQATPDLTAVLAKVAEIRGTVAGVDVPPAPDATTPTGNTATTTAGTTVTIDPATTATPAQTVPIAPTGPGASPAPADKPKYTFDGDPATADSQWTRLSQTTPDGKALFTFAGDTGPAATGDGLGGVWHLYTGPTVG